MAGILLNVTLRGADPMDKKPFASWLLTARTDFKERARGRADVTKAEAENEDDLGLNRALILGLEAAAKVGERWPRLMGPIHVNALSFKFLECKGEIAGRAQALIAELRDKRGWAVQFNATTEGSREYVALASGEKFGS